MKEDGRKKENHKQMDIQSLIDMCTIKLEKEPYHKKALPHRR